MKLCLQPRHLVLALSLSIFFSCKKDDAPPITVTLPEEQASLFDQIQGKWIAKIEAEPRISNHALITNPDFSTKVQDIPRLSSVEFFSNSTYIIAFNNGTSYTNTFNVKDSSTLSTEIFGDISDVKVYGDSLSFTLLYNEMPISVKTARSANISVPDNKKLLLNHWELTKGADGQNEYDKIVILGGDKISYFFTETGTLAVKFSATTDADWYRLAILNWKWHDTNPDAMTFYPVDNEFSGDYIKIAELTSTNLKLEFIQITEGFDEDENVTTSEEVVKTLIFTAE